MSVIAETIGTQGQMSSALKAGLETLDLNATVRFTKYRRVVLPADGFVFWVKADLLSSSALVNTAPVNTVTAGQIATVTVPAPAFDAKGSLHHTTVNTQNADESSSTNRMIFTSEISVDDLAAIAPDTMYLAETDGQRYAFSTRSMWYRQAGLYHYSGDAVYPALMTQIIDNPADLNITDTVVSNSLPIWLGLASLFPIYPGYLVPDNLQPPYAAIDITEADTTPMQAGAFHDRTGSRWQLAKDTVRVVTYGVRNNTIMDWLDMINDYTLDNPNILGIMNSPIPRDDKRGQVEISTIAQKKIITFDASYYQARMLDLSRQIIQSAFIDEFLIPVV